MSNENSMSDDNNTKKVHGTVAEYESVDALLEACRRIRDAGFTKTDAFTPFPVHGIDTALGIKPTKLPWIALAGGATGLTIALLMQIWMNGIDYQYIISGKPYISLPAFMPVAFELTILLASFGAFFGMWALNGLPKFSNPIFTDPRFDRATDDRFFLYIDAKDDSYDQAGAEKLLADTGTEYINTVVEDDSPTQIPKFLITTLVTVIALSFIPALILARMRVTTSSQPRFHIFPDMDFSPARDAQQTTTLFADNRAMRPDVPGTIARGEMEEDLDYLTGIKMQSLALQQVNKDRQLVALYPQDEKASSDTAAEQADAPEKSVMDTTPWVETNPVEITADFVKQGQAQFNIYCSTCHGRDGRGNGLVHQRAQQIMASSWIPPASMHQETLYADQYPDGKLFSTISNGIRKMPGYAGQIKVRDRWAIVAYVRALQQSQNASLNMVPESEQETIRTRKAEVERMLAEQAEAEKKKEEERAKQAEQAQ